MSGNKDVSKKENEMEELYMISNKTKELVNCFPFEKQYINLSVKIDEMVVMLDKIYKAIKSEVFGKFDLNEAYVIINSFHGYLYTPNVENKVVLLSNVKGAIFYQGLDELFDINEDKLLKKLENLTEAQSFTVIRMAFEVIYDRSNMGWNNNIEELLKETFGIK